MANNLFVTYDPDQDQRTTRQYIKPSIIRELGAKVTESELVCELNLYRLRKLRKLCENLWMQTIN